MYAASGVKLSILGSENLKQEEAGDAVPGKSKGRGPTIHKHAIVWFRNLERQITFNLSAAALEKSSQQLSALSPKKATTVGLPGQAAFAVANSELDPFLAAIALVSTNNSIGSAFRVTANGLFVTNEHVVAGATAVSLTLRTGEIVRATVIRTDKAGDIALLRTDSNGPFLKLRGEAVVAEDVWALGAPQGLSFSVSKGVVSAIRQEKGAGRSYIQTDAAVNPGSSGGPLIAIKDGRVLGMNTFGYRNSEGLNFAVSAGDLNKFVGSPQQ
ncbi:MAG TPA: S1C family serine protease [Verrucomicrobiae bacterium]|nr:S1C family serine protease [Verrucomicrobiae bacterium]